MAGINMFEYFRPDQEVFNDNVARALNSSRVFEMPPVNVRAPVAPEPVAPEAIAPEPFDMQARFNQLYQPSHDDKDRYESLLSRMPRINNQPRSLGRAILSGLASKGNPDVGDKFFYRPYNHAMSEWDKEMDLARNLAILERQENQQARLGANTILSNEMSQRRLDETQRRNNDLERQGQQRLDDANARHAADLKLATDKLAEQTRQYNESLKLRKEIANGGQLKDDGYGNLAWIRKDGTVAEVDWGVISEQEKAELRARYQKEVKQTETGNQKANANKPIKSYIEDENGKIILGTLDPNTNEFTPATVAPKKNQTQEVATAGTPSSGSTQETAKIKRLRNLAMQIKASNPTLSKYIQVPKEANGLPTITRPGYIFGPSQADYNKLQGLLYPSATQVPAPAPTVTPSSNNTGRVTIYKNGKAIGTVPANQVEEAKRQGYTVQ